MDSASELGTLYVEGSGAAITVHDDFTLGSGTACSFQIEGHSVSSRHTEIYQDDDVLWITDLNSSHGTFINGNKLNKGQSAELLDGSEISIGGWRAKFAQKKKLGAQQPEPPKRKKAKKASNDFEDDPLVDELRCPICTSIFYTPIRLVPCAHVYCGGCIAQWKDSQRTNGADCPVCRKTIRSYELARNIKSIVEVTIKKYPALVRSAEERDALDACFASLNPVIGKDLQAAASPSVSIPSIVPLYSPSMTRSCFSCHGPAFAGCILCSLNSCRQCAAVLPVRDHPFHALDERCLNRNARELQIFQTMLAKDGISVNEMWRNRVCPMLDDGTCILPADKFRVPIRSDSMVCKICIGPIFGRGVYAYRDSLETPNEFERPDCHWGKECRTQRHNAEHARKYNHICEKTHH